ncbi:MAG: lipoyl synthase [Candidatus Marinimicrobia bacterium]|nr:lipoyl synthase [Candidatus Neomarinimicrobiota bacterium]
MLIQNKNIIVKKPKIRIQFGDGYKFVEKTVTKNRLHTVCEEARCPNIYECWERGTATIMILGDICTRACGFCSVKTGLPNKLDKMEPIRTAMAVKKMALNHVVITSVDRDDLKGDYGAEIWAETIKQIKKYVPKCTVEVLTPDFKGYRPALEIVFNANPDIFSHNIECIERISRKVRAQAVWKRSLDVLKQSVDFGLRTKTGMMVGLGESKDDVIDVMSEIVDLGVEIFTIGQYLQPTKDHLSVERYVDDKEFQYYKQRGLELGFKVVESGSLVRSSYHADEQARLVSEKV